MTQLLITKLRKLPNVLKTLQTRCRSSSNELLKQYRDTTGCCYEVILQICHRPILLTTKIKTGGIAKKSDRCRWSRRQYESHQPRPATTPPPSCLFQSHRMTVTIKIAAQNTVRVRKEGKIALTFH